MKRRSILKAAAAASVASPIVSLFGQSALAAAGDKPIRTLFIYHPNGCVPDIFHPKAGSMVLPAMTAPLESVKQHCVFLDGIGLVGDGATHEGGAAKILTGNHMGGGNLATSSSLDVLMGQANVAKGINQSAPSIQMGLFASKWSDKSISFNGSNRVPYQDNPLALYKSLFSGNTGGTVDPELTANVRLLSKAREDLTRLRAQLGELEKTRLDQHSDALSVLESKINALAYGGGGACSTLDLSHISENDWRDESPTGAMGKISDAQQDIAVLALSCDITRSISFAYSHAVSPITNPEGGLGDHDASHANAATHTKSKVWWMKQIAKFIQKLADTPDGDGDSLLDNTIVCLVSELGHGNYHDHWRVPFVLAGGTNTGLVTGRSLSFAGQGYSSFPPSNAIGASHADLLTLIAQKSGYDISLPLSKGTISGIWS